MSITLQQDSQPRADRRAFGLAEFCNRYGPGRTKAYEEIKSGRLRAIKCGKRTLVTTDDAEAWLMSLPTVASHGGAST